MKLRVRRRTDAKGRNAGKFATVLAAGTLLLAAGANGLVANLQAPTLPGLAYSGTVLLLGLLCYGLYVGFTLVD